jgi:hypothetical protein
VIADVDDIGLSSFLTQIRRRKKILIDISNPLLDRAPQKGKPAKDYGRIHDVNSMPALTEFLLQHIRIAKHALLFVWRIVGNEQDVHFNGRT